MAAPTETAPRADASVYEGFPVIALAGQPDIDTLREFDRKLRAVFNAGHETIFLDFTEAGPLGPDTLRIVERLAAKMAKRGGHFYLIAAAGQENPFAGPVLGPFPSLQEAADAVRPGENRFAWE
ncbi:MAG: hypothetical protein IT210_01850 [Armatimonadetes bacterium]|nr:hypothetical protein [Armatimonadota bacterium]